MVWVILLTHFLGINVLPSNMYIFRNDECERKLPNFLEMKG